MSAEIHQLAIFAARREAADRLREERWRLLEEAADIERSPAPSSWDKITLLINLSRAIAIQRELEELGQ